MAPPVRSCPRPQRSALHKRLDALRTYLDLRDGKQNDAYYLIPLHLQPARTVLNVCINHEMQRAFGYPTPARVHLFARRTAVRLKCAAAARALENIIRIDKVLPVGRFEQALARSLQTSTKRQSAARLTAPKPDEFFADMIIYSMIKGILLGNLDPALSFDGLIGKIEALNKTRFFRITKLVRSRGHILHTRKMISPQTYAAFKTFAVVSADEARTMFKKVLSRYRLTFPAQTPRQPR